MNDASTPDSAATRDGASTPDGATPSGLRPEATKSLFGGRGKTASKAPSGGRAIFTAAVVLQLVVLYWPRTPSEGGLPIDKLIHVTVFGLVMVTGARAGVPRVPLFAVLAVHAPGSELIQHYLLPHRDGDWKDATADLVGVVLGVVVVTPISWRRKT